MEPTPVWKQEPASPPAANQRRAASPWLPFDDDDDDTLYRTEFDVKFEADLLSCESKAEVASQILENLECLMDLDELIKEEPCFLLDEKMLPMLEEVEAPRAVPVLPAVKAEYGTKASIISASSGPYLIGGFEAVYDAVGLGLTPPQSPPPEGHVLAALEPQPQQPVYADITNSKAAYAVPERQLAFGGAPSQYHQAQGAPAAVNYQAVGTPQPDIAHELAVVDELVRTRVEDMQWSSGASGPSSPESSSNSNFGDCSSSSEDPEWAPEPYAKRPGSPLDSPPPQRKRPKPGSRSSPEDKKSRKKEQNKNAATRYRLKKKAEAEEIMSEERKLLDRNTELSNNISDLNREVKYLKGLMRDLFKAKGLIV